MTWWRWRSRASASCAIRSYANTRRERKHAFANETLVGDRKLPIAEYNAPAAELAWKRTIEFFGRHLK